MDNWEKVASKLKSLEREIERLKTGERGGVWTAWTPTFTGFSVDPTVASARYLIVGKFCSAAIRMSAAGTSNATTFTVSAPFAAATITNMFWYSAVGSYYDNGTRYRDGTVYIGSAETSFTVLTGAQCSASWIWTASGDKRASFQIFYEV